MFQIEKNIPAPMMSVDGTKRIYPFASMEVGESFAAPRDMGKRKDGYCKRRNSIEAAASYWSNRYSPKSKFAVRIIDKNTVRCWRVK